jgi:pimeloyl-ACP methyl ester carboxylesterase/quercetin dioxygenase-like cupin family protein
MLEVVLRTRIAFGLILFFMLAVTARAHEINETDFAIDCEIAQVAGMLTMPAHAEDAKDVCVLIVGGTFSHTRDGEMEREGVPFRDALRRLAHALADRGYASVRYDKVGHGESRAETGWTGSYTDEAAVVETAIATIRERFPDHRVVVAGESAGAYLACIAASHEVEADAYIFLGGHCDSGAAIYEYNFARLVALVEGDPDWAEFGANHKYELLLGRHYEAMFAAAARGENSMELADGEYRATIPLARRREELDMPPDEMFRHIQRPALAVSGEYDLNVPPDHAAKIVSVLRSVGNHDSTCILIPGADHSFQLGPEDESQRLRERYSFASFERPYAPQLYSDVIAWLDATFGFSENSSLPAAVADVATPVRAAEGVEIDAVTDATPETIHLAPGVQIIDDIADSEQTAGVDTLEGEIGPLLLGDGCQAHFIDMPAGMYCEEHPHSSESIIYTVRGKWVLCSAGRRHLMQPGTLFRFAPNTPTGYEVPFDENAFILIFKGDRLTESEADFIEYLEGMADRLEREHEAGVPYLMTDLSADHPAIEFARQVNTDFDATVLHAAE